MPRKRYTTEQIINHLREAEVLLSQGQRVGEICRRFGIAEQTYYRWRREYGGLKIDQAKRLKDLEQENIEDDKSKIVSDPSANRFNQIVGGPTAPDDHAGTDQIDAIGAFRVDILHPARVVFGKCCNEFQSRWIDLATLLTDIPEQRCAFGAK
jgi:hypothetical protein